MTGPGMGGRRDAVSLWGGRFAAAAAGSARPVVLAALLPLGLTAQDPQQVALLRGRIGVDPEPGSLLAAPARLTVSGLPLSDALARLAERSRVQIAFSPTLLPEGHRVECDCAALNTARALDRLLAGTDLGYVELGSQVVVVPRAPTEVPRPGGTIRGRVRTEVAVPIEDATARLLFAADSTVHRVTRTDRLGYFVFHDLDPGEYLVAAGRIGYAPHEKTITLAPGDAARLDVALPEQAIALEEVQVDGLGTRDRVRFRESAGETVQEMDRAQLRSIPGLAEADPIRTVGALPGVTAVSEVGASFNVRGGSADQNLILLDGVPIYNPFHMFGLFSIFSADMVRRTALRSGGFPAEYGGRTSSVLLIESDLGDEEFGVEAGVSLIASRVSVTGGLSEALMDGLGLVSARWRIGARRSRWAARLSAGRYVQFLQSVRDESLPVSLDPWVLAGNSGASEVVSTQFQGGVEGFPRRGKIVRGGLRAAEKQGRNHGVGIRLPAQGDPEVPGARDRTGSGSRHRVSVPLRPPPRCRPGRTAPASMERGRRLALESRHGTPAYPACGLPGKPASDNRPAAGRHFRDRRVAGPQER